ncbi:STX7 [Cordylochernes scorpioides]|uniref:STX7 n=1 Tax=Cordylochernes scorpioides TaxID=51811 RepID=A0ABY6KJ78_9ARAC|nr:STX7 [Cordylochernes scorpioides]
MNTQGGYQYQSGYQSGSQGRFHTSVFSQWCGGAPVNQIQKMVNQMGTPQDSETLRSQLHSVHQYTNQLAKDTNVNLKKLAQIYQSSPAMQKVIEALTSYPQLFSSLVVMATCRMLVDEMWTDNNEREQKLMKERLYNDFMTALQNLQTTQREAASKEKESVMRARAHSGIAGRCVCSPTQGKTQTQVTLQMEEEVNLELLREREQAVRQIESTIRDVNQIFKDLAAIVHDQGDVIGKIHHYTCNNYSTQLLYPADSIEANVETAAVQVGQGTQQIIKARNYQSKARRKKICLMIFCLVVLITVIVLAVVLGD